MPRSVPEVFNTALRAGSSLETKPLPCTRFGQVQHLEMKRMEVPRLSLQNLQVGHFCNLSAVNVEAAAFDQLWYRQSHVQLRQRLSSTANQARVSIMLSLPPHQAGCLETAKGYRQEPLARLYLAHKVKLAGSQVMIVQANFRHATPHPTDKATILHSNIAEHIRVVVPGKAVCRRHKHKLAAAMYATLYLQCPWSHYMYGRLQAAYQTTENAEIAKTSSSKANNPRIAGSPLSQLPLNKQMFSSPQLSKTSEPAQQLTPPPTVPTAVAVPHSSKAPSSLLNAPADPTVAPAAVDSPTTASPAVTSDAFSNTPVLGNSSQAAASFASPPTVHTPVSPGQMTGSNFSAAPTSDSVTSPPAFTAVSRLSDAPATPTLFPTAGQSTPAVSHPTPAAPHSTPVAFTGMDTSGIVSRPMFSNQASPDEVATSLQNLNLQSQPFIFADEAPGSGVKASAPAQSAGLSRSMLPGDDSISPPRSHTVPTASEHDSTPNPVEGTMVNDGKIDAQNRQEEEHMSRSEQDTVPVNYVSRRTTDPYMEKKLRGLQVCSDLQTLLQHACQAQQSNISAVDCQ